MKPYQWMYVLAGAMFLFLAWAAFTQGTVGIVMALLVAPIILWTLSNAQKSRDQADAQEDLSWEEEPEAVGLAEELERLAALRAADAITEEEYRAAKAKLLGKRLPPAQWGLTGSVAAPR